MKADQGWLTASPVVEGIGIGRAVVWASDPAPRPASGTVAEERARLARAILRARCGLAELVRLLPRAEAELFEPELAILDELEPVLAARIDAGATPEGAVEEVATGVPTDLLIDARARLLDALAHDHRSVESHLEGRAGERVLVTASLTPSVVATLPTRVVGIVAARSDALPEGAGYASHAAILARGRDIPLVLVEPAELARIADDDMLVLDATASPARVHVQPDPAVLADAHAGRESWMLARAEEETGLAAQLTHLGVAVHVNVGSLYEHIPASAEGIGLLRTELVFSDHATAPSEAEQTGVLRAVAASLPGAPIVVRLFDAGSDKPLPWLRPPPGAASSRGIELLRMFPEVLEAQLRAIQRAAHHADLRILLPLVTGPGDVERIRALSGGGIPVGAMIETPGAANQIDAIAAVADFISIGTNDLFAEITGQHRADAPLSFDRHALRLVARVVERAHAHGRKVSVCGEIAANPGGAHILVGMGVDALSVAATRFARVKLSLRETTRAECIEVTRAALAG